MSNPSFLDVKTAVEKWWENLKVERKCNSTNTVQKLVSNSSVEIQEEIREVISKEINKVIEECYKTSDLCDFQRTSYAINGCFDNFSHAIDAIRLSFVNIIKFINSGLVLCNAKWDSRASQKNAVLELLHSLSRILILVLKLRRNHIAKYNTGNDTPITPNFRCLLSSITYKIGHFLVMDDILMDTKNNLSMSAILIREILAPDEEKLKEFHTNFIKSLPLELSDEDFKVNILKFLMCSAIINTWSVDIIDCPSTNRYLKFFISLCEKYSSETPVVLNASRTLLLLIKHESFQVFVTKSDEEDVKQTVNMLLSCIFMLLEHPVACVRYSAKDFLQVLAAHPNLHSLIIDSVFKLPTDKRSYFISIGALANEIGSKILIKSNPELPAQLIAALLDPTIVSHVSLALENVILKDSLAEKDFSKWCETYIVPLLKSLVTALPIVVADIEKLLEKAFKKYPNSVIYVIEKWACPTSEELRYVITALKISEKQGLKLKNNCHLTAGKENASDGGKDLINEKLLEHCLHQCDDNIRVSAFSLLIEAHKSTKPYSESDFKLILYFLKYNLNNQQPATRQKILGLIRKMLVRFSESKATFLRSSKNEIEQEVKAKNCLMYDQFLNSLVDFCFSNIFVGCNFNRLNTVLTILILCFEYVKNMAFNSLKTNFYWSKFLIALDSSYEENKRLAVVLANKLNLSLLITNNSKSTRSLFEQAFDLCSHMEPPDVLTGAYLLQSLTNFPLSKEVLSTYFVRNYAFDDSYYFCILALMEKLKEQIQLAKLDLMTAATCGPMYGTLFAIRLTFKNVDFSDCDQDREPQVLKEWGRILNELVELCFEMNKLVGCVVNSSSPEGHLPMDFQTDIESLLSRDLNEKCEITSESQRLADRDKIYNLLSNVYNNFHKKFRKLQSEVKNFNCDTYECLRGFSALLKENQLLSRKIRTLYEGNALTGIGNIKSFIESLDSAEAKIKNHIEKLQKNNSVIEWPSTAQVLLLCSWRSIKESSLYLGDFFTKVPIERGVELGLFSKTMIVRVGEELKTLLCEIKHRGAFEHAYIGFTQLVNSLWKCADKDLCNLPRQWLEDIINQLKSPISDQKVKLCSTRRSAGLPFLVQAIICSELVSLKSTTPSSLHTTMQSLFSIIEQGVSENPDSKIHALNVLRALFKHTLLGEHVAPYASRALMAAIRGSRAATWSERNSSSLLFSSLITRIFGVSRSRDEISKKNRMTSRTFFQRYSEQYDFLLSEMELVYSEENNSDGIYPKPSLYLVLLVLGRLYPPPTEDPENINLSKFLPYINMSRENPVMKIRVLGAQALVPLISLDRLTEELDERFKLLSLKSGITENERHGILLQVKELLYHSQEAFENFLNKTSDKREIKWIETTKWMLECPKEMSLFVVSSYVRVLHTLFRNLPNSREKMTEIISKMELEHFLNLSPEKQRLLPGIYLFLESFYFLKTDILAYQWLNSSSNGQEFIELFAFMLNSNISEVQSVPLRILGYILRENYNQKTDFDDDDFCGIGVPLTELLFLKSKQNVKNIQTQILNDSNILKLLVEPLNKQHKFNSTIIHRVWLSVVSTLVMNDVIAISHSTSSSEQSLNINFAKSLIKSGDKEISTASLTCYAIYLMEEVLNKSENIPSEEKNLLTDIFNEFSSSEADVKERLTVAKIFNRCFKSFQDQKTISDPNLLKIWTIPLRLLADEDSEVRLVSSELIHKMQELIAKEIPEDEIIMKMTTSDWPHSPLVSLRSQECLLDSYINLVGRENLIYLLVQMFIMAVSVFSDLEDMNTYSKDEFGVFEKGNPNPYCEDQTLSNLICAKLFDLKSVIDLDVFLWIDLDPSLGKFISENLHLTDFIPHSLMEMVEMITIIVEEKLKLKSEFSLPRVQVRNLRKTLGLSEIV